MVKRDFIRNIILALLAIVIFILLRIFVFSTFEIHKEAENAYLKNGDLVTIRRNIKPKYKDFVVYRIDDKDYISRVVASAGQSATSMDDILYINNQVVDEPYIEKTKNDFLTTSPMGSLFTEDFNITTISKGNNKVIPSGKYLLLNDNRQNKNDSREFGLIDKSQIKGVITFKILPLDQFGFIENE